jgi:hypothetical protein
MRSRDLRRHERRHLRVQDQDWNDGNPIPQDVTGSVETASSVKGNIWPVLVCHVPLTPGEYDIVIDANQNGIYDASTEGRDSRSPGVVVIVGINRNHRSDWFVVCYRDS